MPILRNVIIPPEENSVCCKAPKEASQPTTGQQRRVQTDLHNLPDLQRMSFGLLSLHKQVQTTPTNGQLQQQASPVSRHLLSLVWETEAQAVEEQEPYQDTNDHSSGDQSAALWSICGEYSNSRKANIEQEPGKEADLFERCRCRCECIVYLVGHRSAAASHIQFDGTLC